MKTKSILLISIAALVALSGCSSHLALVDFGKPATSFAALPRKPSPAAAPTTVAATSLAAADAQVEKVTVTAAAKITAATAKLRAEAPASVFVSKTADEIDAAVASVLAEIKAHPSAVVGKTLTQQAAKIDADAAPDWRILTLLYALAVLCFLVAGVAAFARGWLATVPIVGAYLADNIGKHLCALLPIIGVGLIVVARAYAWACRHPLFVDALAGLILVAGTILYINTYDAGLFGRIGAWFKARLPWVKHTAQVIEERAEALEKRIATIARVEIDKLHGRAAAAPAKPPAPPAAPMVPPATPAA